ncbi:MAG: phenylalanine--tRNA ligase subunit beta [Candidatus Lambdaproteobacteria bacterium]|nr:phenylalanine--tRNA ligase subunit beta [Candidatus Lambdaproteobacteria bacterium]
MALRVPISWLRDFVDVPLAPQELAERLTLAGLEVESINAIGAQWDPQKIVVGHITAIAPHPDADRLCLCTVDYGAAAPLTVVTGAPNLTALLGRGLPATPLKAPFAMVGAELIDGHAADGRTLKLKAGNIRGVRSEGMVCSEKELGLSEDHEGILLLPPDAPTGMPLNEYLGDHVLEFDIKGGFAHLLCVHGVAREAAALLGTPLRSDVWRVGGQHGHTRSPTPPFMALEIADPQRCLRFTATLVQGVRIGPSPFWMQQRLVRAGMRPINAVVDVTNYVMLELGQPLHAFDFSSLRGEQGGGRPLIRVRCAHPGEGITTLDGVQRPLDEQMLLITDGGGAVGIAGIMGGLESEVTERTTDVLIECASFEFLSIRRTSQLLKLRTEAGDRFGKRLDPERCAAAGMRAAYLIHDICGGTVHPVQGDVYPRPLAPQAITLPLDFVHHLLGVPIPRTDVVRILEALEFRVEGEDPLRVTPPLHRLDIGIPADLVEEIGRIYGYDRMAPTLIEDALPNQRRNMRLDGTERVRDLLTGCGLDEIITYSMIALEDEARLHPERQAVAPEDYVALRNPLATERGHMRRRLLAGALGTARDNLRFLPRVRMFEVGRVFQPRAGAVLPDEPLRLCAVMAGLRQPASWHSGRDETPMDFFDIKGVAETLLDGLSLGAIEWRPGEQAAYHPGRCAQVSVGDTPLGAVGELHPRVAQAFGLGAHPVCALEFDLEALLVLWQDGHQMTPIFPHPPVYEDLAFIVDAALSAGDVQRLIAQTGRPLVTDVRLFDLYQDSRLGEGRKSLAFALTYQSLERTLTDQDVAKVRARIVKRLEHELHAQLRA